MLPSLIQSSWRISSKKSSLCLKSSSLVLKWKTFLLKTGWSSRNFFVPAGSLPGLWTRITIMLWFFFSVERRFSRGEISSLSSGIKVSKELRQAEGEIFVKFLMSNCKIKQQHLLSKVCNFKGLLWTINQKKYCFKFRIIFKMATLL